MIDGNLDEAPSRGLDSSRRKWFKRLVLLAGGAVCAPLLARGTALSALAQEPAAPAGPKPGHILVFADGSAPALTGRLKANGYAATAAHSLPHARALAAEIATSGSGGIAVIGAGAGVSATLQFARDRASVKSVIVFGDGQGSALGEFAALHAPRGYSVLVLDAVERADWAGARRWLDRHLA